MRRLTILLFLAAAACGSPTQPPAPTFRPTDSAAPVPTFTPAIASAATVAPEATPPDATTSPDPDAFLWAPLATGLVRPVDIQDPHDGSARLFILEQPGRIRLVENGQLVESPFLDISEVVEDRNNEQGLLGLAFHPLFEDNGFFYVNYTEAGGDTVIARFQVPPGSIQADATTEQRLLGVDQPFPNHNGGALAFGPDGYLYIALGDGGSGGDPRGNGQSLDTLLGKVLRIDVDSGEAYHIPADNPFGTEIWHYGLRNPWRISFDPLNGAMYIADVGQNEWEEINYAPAATGGLNFGWNIYEGNHPFEGGSAAGLVTPVAEYSHADGCSVSGGYVYRGAMPEWQGIYLFADYCSGNIWGLLASPQGWQSQLLFQTEHRVTSFGQDASGEIYLADLLGGIYKLVRR